MLLALFMVGSFWFWALMVLMTCLMLVFIENEKPFWATSAILLTFGALHFFGDFNVFAAAVRHPVTAVVMTAAYFVLGTVYAVFKWWRFVSIQREKYDELKREFLSNNGVFAPFSTSTVPAALQRKWEAAVGDMNSGYRRRAHSVSSVAPSPKAHKGLILTWMCYWPWSFVWTMINDPVKRLFRYIYSQIQSTLQRISDHAFRGVEADFGKPPAPPAEHEDDGSVSVREQREHD